MAEVTDASPSVAEPPTAARPTGGEEPTDAPARRARPARKRTRAGWRLLAVVAAVVLLAEGYVRVIASHLPPPTAETTEVSVKAVAIRSLASQPPDAVVLGDSMMDAGVDPTLVQQRWAGHTLYNASMMGARAGTQLLWAHDVVFPALRPKLVVQGLAPNIVSTLGLKPDELQLWETLRNNNIDVLRDDVWQNLDEWASSHSYLVRHRGELRNPRLLAGSTWARVSGAAAFPDLERPPGFWQGNISPGGQVTAFGGGLADPKGPPSLIDQTRYVVDGDVSTAGIDDLFEYFARQGARSVVVIPPVALDIMANNGIDVARWRFLAGVIRERAAAKGIPVLDFTDAGYRREEFFDIYHLNRRGTERFSLELGDRLSALCRDQPDTCS